MPQATQAAFDARVGLHDDVALDDARGAAAVGGVRLFFHHDLNAVEREWRAFEQVADGTVFQSFDWVSTWQRHIGALEGIAPVIVTGRDSRGALLFLLPLGVETRGFARRLTWLGTELCDYNGPLLAPEFADSDAAQSFAAIWNEILVSVRRARRFDVVHLDKMQPTVGAQPSPFMALGTFAHPNGAYVTRLFGDWETFYAEKRSSATRRRDRTKRKRLGEFGELRFVTPPTPAEVSETLTTLVEQKSGQFAAMGVPNIFLRPGHCAFYEALAAQPHFVHVSRLDVGPLTAAANLGLIFRGSYYHLLASYDAGEISRNGPGAAHMHDLLRYAIGRGCVAFDFTIGDERYKKEWADAALTLYDHVAAETPRGLPLALKLALSGRLKRIVKQTPAIWRVAERVRSFIGPAMKALRG